MKTRMLWLGALLWLGTLSTAQTVHGFADIRAGLRTQDDPVEEDVSLAEARLQLDYSRYVGPSTITLRADLLYDDQADTHTIDLERGEGWLDLREANWLFSPTSIVDVKLGRQILTWGTGDLLFINDLFPKDWQSFFTGRDTEYLKAPSDAVFVSFFPSFANIDIAYTPRFDADRFITGERISFWNQNSGRRFGRDAIVEADRPEEWLEDDEIALRISRNIKGWELAAYGYRGYWKSPGGFDPDTRQATFPELQVLGLSARGQLGRGIFNAEMGWYDSKDDPTGANALVRNGELRWLFGFQHEVGDELTAAYQYYLEWMLDHGDYKRGLVPGQNQADERRHVVTLRLTKMLMNQNLMLSLFGYYSPSDQDAYLRPSVNYKVSDDWQVSAGANLFMGLENHTFFAQFERNSNVYGALRYSF